MDLANFADNVQGDKRKKIFGRLFEGDAHGNGLLAAYRWPPIAPRHYAAHAGLKPKYVEKEVLRGLVERERPFLKAVTLSSPSAVGRPFLMYALTKFGHTRLLDLAENYWPDVWPEEAIGPFVRANNIQRWKPNLDHDFVTRDILLAAERDARHLAQATILDQVAEFHSWGGKRAPTALETPLGRRMKSDAANIMGQGDVSFVDEIEIDLGHETLSSNNPNRVFETIEGKIKSYWSVLAAGMVQAKYQVTSPIFRVLFVTVNEARANHIAELAGTCGLEPIETGKRPIQPSDIFLASTIDQAKAQFFGPHWIKPDGAKVALAKRIEP